MVQTPIIYPGGKTTLLPHIRKLVPPHDLCLDLFGGGAAFILDASHERGVYNDVNSNSVNFFRVLRDPKKSETLHRLLRRTPYSRDEYHACLSTWQNPALDDVERARQWFVIVNCGFTHEEDCTSFRISVGNNPASALANHIDRIPEVVERLRRVTIENLDFRHALKIYGHGKNTLIFADPPYMTGNDDSVAYRHKFTMSDHIDLLHLLNKSECQVILCGYQSDIYEMMLDRKKWKLVTVTRKAQVGNSDYSDRDLRVEHIWVKKNLGGLFDEY